MLELSDPQWSKLRGPFGSSEEIPRLLAQLQKQYDTEVRDELFWDHLYHQNTLYSCTYAAVPYLADLAQNSDNLETKLDIYSYCGLFEASNGNGPECEVPDEFTRDQIEMAPETAKEIYRAYQAALAALAGMKEPLTEYVRTTQPESEKRYFLAASAAFAGYRDASGMLLTFPEGEEYVFGCSGCGEDIYIWPDNTDGGRLIAYKDDPVFVKNEQGYRIESDPLDKLEEGSLRFLHRQAGLVEDQTMLAHLPYLGGSTDCPHCGIRLSIWPGLLGIFQQRM